MSCGNNENYCEVIMTITLIAIIIMIAIIMTMIIIGKNNDRNYFDNDYNLKRKININDNNDN